MVAGIPICNSIFSAILNVSGYVQDADVALGTAVQNAISVSYIWVENIACAVCAVLIFLFTVEKDLPKEQEEIAKRKI